jgi:Druantia protein DruA
MACRGGRAGETVLRYRNREITESDLEFLRTQCASWATRHELVQAVCEAWQWRQANGAPSTYACKDLLLRLEERGLLELPARLRQRRSSKRRRFTELPLPPELIPLTGLEVRDPEADLSELCVRPIFSEERLGWRLYMERFHYLGDRPVVGEHLLYAALLDSEVVALLGWASAALRAPLRDEYVGWDEATKRALLHLVANNIRFLILPWVRVRHLASKVLALNLRRLSRDWETVWKHPILLAETFVDTTRFRGTCYRAANWLYLGETAGRSKRGNNYLHGGTKKALFVYPLDRHARQRLREGT